MNVIYADQTNDLEHKLQKVQAAIEKTKALVASEKQREHQQADQLQRLEHEFKTAEKELQSLENELFVRTQEVNALEQQETVLNGDIGKQQAVLNKQLKNLFLLQKSNALKMLINFDAPHSLDRLFQYHRYLKNFYYEQLKQAMQELQQLSERKGKLTEERSVVHTLKETKQEQQQVLAQLKLDHAKALDKIQISVSAEQQKLVKMQKEEQKLIEDLAVIQTALKSASASSPLSVLSFSRMKGRVHWPLRSNFDPKNLVNPSTSSQNPIIIPTKADEPVYAIHQGRVVFAEALRGFGLLLILDHGNGYMSLYGHNHSLYKQVGDTVESNEMIARVGSMEESSELRNSSLYFEIRKNGKPVNLVGWFK